MPAYNKLIASLESGVYDSLLLSLYTGDEGYERTDLAKNRIKALADQFVEKFGCDDETQLTVFSAPGRTEIGGNHTDHQRGNVLCASVDLDMLACAAPNEADAIRIRSEGYPDLKINLNDLRPRDEEVNTSAALVRGVAARIAELGYYVGGFDACVTSNVLSGSGLSSSAAYEVMIGNIMNHFFCGGELNAFEIAKIGQYAENVYFGKPCGLMDQMASSVGGAVSIDFKDPLVPVVEKVDYDFAASGHALCIIDTGSCHADLTNDYADITREMGTVAQFFEKEFLRDVPEEKFSAAIPVLREQCGDRAVLRAIHFYEDDARVKREVAALKQGNFEEFLRIVNSSGISSALNLQNIWSVSDPNSQAVSVALAVGRRLLNGTGAIRVHGGGFAGTIQAFVPYEKLKAFKSGMENLLGAGKCHVLRIRPKGGCIVID